MLNESIPGFKTNIFKKLYLIKYLPRHSDTYSINHIVNKPEAMLNIH